MQNTNALNINDRLNICKSCPIYSPARGICNPRLWINPENNDVSSSPQSGYIRGCGCNIFYKAKNPSNHCNAGKW